MKPLTATATRVVAAVGILVGGLVHVRLYFDGYRSIPNANLGRSFLANSIASALVAALLVARPDKLIRLAGIGVAAGTLGAFFLSRTSKGIFGFTEKGFQPSPEAAIAFVAEILALLLLGATLVADRNPAQRTPLAVGIGALAVAAAATIGVGAATAHKSTKTAMATTTTIGAAAVAPETTAAGAAAPSATNGGPTLTAAGGAGTAAQAIDIKGFAFAPAQISVNAGTTLTWTNEDSFAHTVVANDQSFKSGNLNQGQSYSFTFAKPGTYSYICGIHASMTATVTVT